MKKYLVLMAVLSIIVIFGCNQHKSPAAITGAGYSDPMPNPAGHVNNTSQHLPICPMSGLNSRFIVVNSQAAYNQLIAQDNFFALAAASNPPAPIDFFNKTLIGYVAGYGGPVGIEFTGIVSDGASVTVNVKLTSTFCLSGPQYLETCNANYTIADKINLPVYFQVTAVTLDCSGNPTTPPVWQPCATCTPGTYAGCVNGPVSFTAFTDGSGFPAPGFYSDTRENIAITTQAEYDAFIVSHYMYYGVAGAPTPVPVDFSKKALIAVFMGQMPDTCFSTDVDSITGTCALSYIVGAVPLQILTVNVKETYPPMGAMCGQMITRPEKLVLVDRVNGAIGFNYLP